LGLSKEIINAQLMGFLFGLAWDVFSTDIFGVRTVMFTVIGYLAGRFYRNFDREKVLTQVVIIFFAGAVYWSGFGLIYFIFPDNGNRAFSFSILLVFSKIVVTAMFAPLVFYILEKMDIIYQKLRRD
jgi:rod shape-determining protein MreD